MKTTMFLLDDAAVAKLKRVANELHGGTDRERDYGHRLWLVLQSLEVVEYDHAEDTLEFVR